MSLLSWFQATPKVVDTAADIVKDAASGIDMLFFTDEEKSIASAKIMDSVIRMNEAQKDENSVRARARRLLAFLIIGNYLCLVDAAAIAGGLGNKDLAAFLFDVANEALGAHVLAVVIFYFGYYGIKSVFKTTKGK